VIRLRVTDLETLRYWKANEDATVDDLVARLTHKEPPTAAMEAGHAFALLMETAQDQALVSAESEGWSFYFDLDGEVALPRVRELKGEAVFETPHGPVTLVGKVDGIEGLTIHDQKLSEKFDAERYLDSLQWRAYLAIFGATKFVYDIFVCRRDDARREVAIYDYHPLPFYAYPQMRADLEKAVCELADVYVNHIIPRSAA
jgi:hypothetical protein